MTQEEILEYNKRCAEFLGAKNLGKLGYSDHDYYEHELFERTEWSNKYQDTIEVNTMVLSQMTFHYDWNWIMEMIEKILDIALEIDSMEMYYNIKDAIPDINATTLSINQFLIWYEQNK